jgi:hypothetical protein
MRRGTPFVAPQVVVVGAVTSCDGYTDLELRGSLAPYRPAFAPAGLYDLETERVEAAQLHKFVSANPAEERAVFRTFAPHCPSPRLANGRYVYRPWWTPDQFALVLDLERIWSRERYPDDGSHEHCFLSWESIASYADNKEGYRSGGLWITVDAYEKYIRDDIFRCRQ